MSSNARAYDKICKEWQAVRSAMPVNQCVLDLVKHLPEGACVLDVGCGTGEPIASYLISCGFLVTGIDVSVEMIDRAQQLDLKTAKFEVCDVMAYQPQVTYDAVVAFDSLFHLPQDQQAQIYPLMASFLNPGGYFLFTHGKEEGSITGDMFGQTFHYASLDAHAVRNLLVTNDFTIVDWLEDYEEPTTGQRDLLVLARKVADAARAEVSSGC